MKLFLEYLWHKKAAVAAFLVCWGIFGLVFLLYDTVTEAVLYAGLLCIIILAIMVIIGFARFKARCDRLKEVLENIEIMTDCLPLPQDITERYYNEIIHCQAELIRSCQNRYNKAYSDNLDYFITWVHQIKTPLSVMNMMLKQQDTDYSRELSSQAFKIEQYAEMALNYIRLDSKENDFLFKSYSLDSIIRECIRKYAPQFIHKKLVLHYDGCDAEIVTDKKWLGFIIEQLLSNAVKYTDSGSISIAVKNDSDRVIITVSDTGIGIRPEDLPRIFEKGYTGFNGRNENKSSGLGLYLCRKTADKLGVDITAEAEIGKGSAFSVIIDTKVKQYE